jgi:hypothetical protein
MLSESKIIRKVLVLNDLNCINIVSNITSIWQICMQMKVLGIANMESYIWTIDHIYWICDIWDFHGGEDDDDVLLGFGTV